MAPLYFAREREVLVRGDKMIPIERHPPLAPGEKPQRVVARMRMLGCTYCTGAIRSSARTVPEIIKKLRTATRSERKNRLIDHDLAGSVERKSAKAIFDAGR